jgi:hypothetical protein
MHGAGYHLVTLALLLVVRNRALCEGADVVGAVHLDSREPASISSTPTTATTAVITASAYTNI